MRTVNFSILALALLGVACGQDEGAQGSGDALSTRNDADETGDEQGSPSGGVTVADAGDFLSQCVRGGGSVGMIQVVFDCDSITVYSCKDLSNVVLEFADGRRQKFDGLSGQAKTFSGTGDNDGDQVVGVWVKAGSNASGDGPGYGQRFDAPEQDCTPPEAGSGGSGGSCGSNDPDAVCGGGGLGGSGEGGSAGSENGGTPICSENPDDPACHVD